MIKEEIFWHQYIKKKMLRLCKLMNQPYDHIILVLERVMEHTSKYCSRLKELI